MKRENITRKDLAEAIHQKMGFSKRSSAEIVDLFFDAMKDALLHGDNVKIVQFGSFNLRKKAPRQGRNPRTGEPMEISSRSMVSFKPCKALRERINR